MGDNKFKYDNCSTYQPTGTKTITCIDCGEEVEVDAKDNKTVRCEKCTKTHRNNYQKELMRKRRNKEK